MEIAMTTRTTTLASLLAACSCAVAAGLAGAAPRVLARAGAGGLAARQTPENHAGELRDIGEALAKKHHVSVVIDPGLVVSARPAAPAKDATIEKALAGLVAPLRNASWRRVYLQSASSVPPAKLADRLRALDRVGQAGMVVEDPATRRGTLMLPGYPLTPSFKEQLTRQQYRPVYVVYGTGATAAAAAAAAGQPPAPNSGVADTFGDMLGAFFDMDAEARAQAMGESMALLMSLDAGSRAEFIGQMWTSMTPELQKDVTATVVRIIQQQQQGGGGPGRQ
jgi:hypothetical protein